MSIHNALLLKLKPKGITELTLQDSIPGMVFSFSLPLMESFGPYPGTQIIGVQYLPYSGITIHLSVTHPPILEAFLNNQ